MMGVYGLNGGLSKHHAVTSSRAEDEATPNRISVLYSSPFSVSPLANSSVLKKSCVLNPPLIKKSPSSHIAVALIIFAIIVPLAWTEYTLVPLMSWVIPGVSCRPCVPLNPRSPCMPCAPISPCGPADLLAQEGLVGLVFLFCDYLISFLSSSLSNLLNLQNSTEPTKKPSKGPVLHSYLFISVGYCLYISST